MDNTHEIQLAIQLTIEQLFNNSAANRENIEKGKTTSTSLRNEIQIASLELERDNFSLHASEHENLTRSRAAVSEGDGHFLKTSIDAISKHVKDNQTDTALALSDKLEQNVTLLRKRLQYIAALEQLLKDYEQEKQLRAQLKAVAKALGLSLQVEEQVNETPHSEVNPALTAPVLEAYPPNQAVSKPTLH